MVQQLEKYINLDILFCPNCLSKLSSEQQILFCPCKIYHFKLFICLSFSGTTVHNFFLRSLTILTGTPGFLFKIKNKRLTNTIILSEPIQKNAKGIEFVNDGNASGIFVYYPGFSRRSIKYCLPFKTVFPFGRKINYVNKEVEEFDLH